MYGRRVRHYAGVPERSAWPGHLHLATRNRRLRAEHLHRLSLPHSSRPRPPGCRTPRRIIRSACDRAPQAWVECRIKAVREGVPDLRGDGTEGDGSCQGGVEAGQGNGRGDESSEYSSCFYASEAPADADAVQAWRKLDAKAGPGGVPEGMVFGLEVYDPRLSYI